MAGGRLQLQDDSGRIGGKSGYRPHAHQEHLPQAPGQFHVRGRCQGHSAGVGVRLELPLDRNGRFLSIIVLD